MDLISHFLNFYNFILFYLFWFFKFLNVTSLKNIYFKMLNIIFIVLNSNDVISQHVKLSFDFLDSIIR